MQERDYKLIINGFNGSFSPVVYSLIENLKPQYCAVINTEKISIPQNVKVDYFNYYDLRLCNYLGVDWNSIMPLDSILIEKMSDCETIVLKMIERLEPSGIDVRAYNNRKCVYLKHLRYWNHIIESKKVNIGIFAIEAIVTIPPKTNIPVAIARSIFV